jgi:hypothetical protein
MRLTGDTIAQPLQIAWSTVSGYDHNDGRSAAAGPFRRRFGDFCRRCGRLSIVEPGPLSA